MLLYVSKKNTSIYNEFIVTTNKSNKSKFIWNAVNEFIQKEKDELPLIINELHWGKCFDNLEGIKDFQKLQQEINNLQLYKNEVERTRFKK